MGGIDEELHLGFLQVFLAMALISVDDIQDDACCYQEIEEKCPGGSAYQGSHTLMWMMVDFLEKLPLLMALTSRV